MLEPTKVENFLNIPKSHFFTSQQYHCFDALKNYLSCCPQVV